MAIIILNTTINAPAERCFLLSLSVDLHKVSTKHTHEEAISGVMRGCMKLNDTVTWRAKHLGLVQHMTTKISAYNSPSFFVSEMQKGPFKKMHHQHIFDEKNGVTIMKDVFEMQAPLGWLGKIAEKIFLTSYMKKLLERRNETIKMIAESEDWKKYL